MTYFKFLSEETTDKSYFPGKILLTSDEKRPESLLDIDPVSTVFLYIASFCEIFIGLFTLLYSNFKADHLL